MLTNRRSMMAPPTNRASSFHPGTLPDPNTEPHCRTPSVLTATTDTLPAHRIVKPIGTVHGMTVCARKDTKAFLKAAGNGTTSEARSLMLMMYNARDQAMERMIKDCISRGGNAIVGVNFGESEMLGMVQVSVYGTAVFVEREASPFKDQ